MAIYHRIYGIDQKTFGSTGSVVLSISISRTEKVAKNAVVAISKINKDWVGADRWNDDEDDNIRRLLWRPTTWLALSPAVIPSCLAASISSTLSFKHAAVPPSAAAVCTASAGLFQQQHLNLPSPSLNRPPTPREDWDLLLVWGGTNSVRCNAIQPAAAAA
ncbi:hypothetical protein EYZ11_003340 [Aspergillus tanneri]|uniref:Uncharacterized protein n=1 Tax=Aspergillus tanneri TaxID=1220188 RepID=A0A4S3JNQ0_9EURO|nr:uncharacterized protein ATNIH1004_002378 [Aspergillus tanneri]KAA8649704.1 hypothetical protein ATNIH1004_002378 [Aspergillus tanneri]THC97175.1 hypothetical protein EYZ11_003340 [Aspergillus tanneri]